jgi:enoyl-CoA hydratase
MPADYSGFSGLEFDRPEPGVLRMTIARGPMNSMDFDLHHSLVGVWDVMDRDPETRAVLVTGRGRAFSAGGDFDMVDRILDDYEFRMRMWQDGRALVQRMIDFAKPVVSGINGAAAGGGLAVALLADISIAARSAKLADGHVRLGVTADDHAALIWPLLCGMAKAKYYLMTGAAITGEEAERIGLVSMCVDDADLATTALATAAALAQGPPTAIRWTKLSLNNWLKAAWPTFEASLAYGILGFSGPEPSEGLAALRERRAPVHHPEPPAQ